MANLPAKNLPSPDASWLPNERWSAPLHKDGHVEKYYFKADKLESLPRPEQQPLHPIVARNRTSKQEESFIAAFCSLLVEHQIGLAVNLLLLLFLTHASIPRSRRHTRKFFELSYYDASTQRYGVGWDDMFLVSFWIIVFTGLRVTIMDYLLVPLAQRAGISKRKEKIRFAEQAWILIYPSLFWSLGMYIMYRSDYWLNLKGLWAGWPDREMHAIAKWYYLVQFAFWLQQILVVNIEEHRSDYAQMFTHHVVTCALLLTSYGYHQTKVGNLIMCLMDVVDLVLPTAKLLKYMKFQLACDIAFVVFVIVWFVSRHVLYLVVCYSIYADIPKAITYGCYWGSNKSLQGPIDPPDRFGHLFQPFVNPEGLVCWDSRIAAIFLGMLLFLQVILSIWLSMIIKVAYKVIQGEEADDIRSDDEEEKEGTKEIAPSRADVNGNNAYIEVSPLEEEVGVESINLTKRSSKRLGRPRKSGVTASGVTLPSDRKELLGRIGCDKSE